MASNPAQSSPAAEEGGFPASKWPMTVSGAIDALGLTRENPKRVLPLQRFRDAIGLLDPDRYAKPSDLKRRVLDVAASTVPTIRPDITKLAFEVTDGPGGRELSITVEWAPEQARSAGIRWNPPDLPPTHQPPAPAPVPTPQAPQLSGPPGASGQSDTDTDAREPLLRQVDLPGNAMTSAEDRHGAVRADEKGLPSWLATGMDFPPDLARYLQGPAPDDNLDQVIPDVSPVAGASAEGSSSSSSSAPAHHGDDRDAPPSWISGIVDGAMTRLSQDNQAPVRAPEAQEVESFGGFPAPRPSWLSGEDPNLDPAPAQHSSQVPLPSEPPHSLGGPLIDELSDVEAEELAAGMAALTEAARLKSEIEALTLRLDEVEGDAELLAEAVDAIHGLAIEMASNVTTSDHDPGAAAGKDQDAALGEPARQTDIGLGTQVRVRRMSLRDAATSALSPLRLAIESVARRMTELRDMADNANENAAALQNQLALAEERDKELNTRLTEEMDARQRLDEEMEALRGEAKAATDWLASVQSSTPSTLERSYWSELVRLRKVVADGGGEGGHAELDFVRRDLDALRRVVYRGEPAPTSDAQTDQRIQDLAHHAAELERQIERLTSDNGRLTDDLNHQANHVIALETQNLALQEELRLSAEALNDRAAASGDASPPLRYMGDLPFQQGPEQIGLNGGGVSFQPPGNPHLVTGEATPAYRPVPSRDDWQPQPHRQPAGPYRQDSNADGRHSAVPPAGEGRDDDDHDALYPVGPRPMPRRTALLTMAFSLGLCVGAALILRDFRPAVLSPVGGIVGLLISLGMVRLGAAAARWAPVGGTLVAVLAVMSTWSMLPDALSGRHGAAAYGESDEAPALGAPAAGRARHQTTAKPSASSAEEAAAAADADDADGIPPIPVGPGRSGPVKPQAGAPLQAGPAGTLSAGPSGGASDALQPPGPSPAGKQSAPTPVPQHTDAASSRSGDRAPENKDHDQGRRGVSVERDDRPPAAAPQKPPSRAPVTGDLYEDADHVLIAQKVLKVMAIYMGEATGTMDERFRDCLAVFQNAANIPRTRKLDGRTWEKIQEVRADRYKPTSP
ncbi:hypothetical protein [Azospirillum sp. B4]|uniref:hypothetical protein n=1 Tax=Azospirillum sp. B4 TaxID=95605 RepID=UPI0003475FAD|nr:hypothetical protein [Azospirillum sp. B4]